LADVYIRLLELDEVARQLERADELQHLVNVPLSAEVAAQYEAFVASRGPLERPTLGRELEYGWIYEHTAYDLMRLQFITASYRHRVGDIAGAVESVDLLAPVLEHLPENLGSGYGVEEVMWVIAILRDAARYEDAQQLLADLEELPAATGRMFDIHYMRGLMWDVQGEAQLAFESYERAFADSAHRRQRSMVPRMQFAASLMNVGRPEEAMAELGKIDLERDAQSDRDRLYYYTLAAWVYDANGRRAAALEAVDKALPMVEQIRSEIADPRSRSSWQGQQHNLFSIAVKVRADAGMPVRAWETIERSRSRTLLDELRGRPALAELRDEMVSALETIEQAIRLIDRYLLGDVADPADAVFRTEGTARLADVLERQFPELAASDAFRSGDFAAVREALVERHAVAGQREQRARDQAARPTTALLEFRELVGMLEK
jgi:tetratricopeptide (TPR) repeat protein